MGYISPMPDTPEITNRNEDRPGRSGPDVGDNSGGEGTEFAGDAAFDPGATDISEADRKAWSKARGSDTGTGPAGGPAPV
jgi:hypothetical protein